MVATVKQFLKHLSDSGILAQSELTALQSRITPQQLDQDAQHLAKDLVRRKKLTLFQANALYSGRPRGLTLGNYIVLDRIGAGGMGVVFRARHRRMKRLVALKVVSLAAMNSPDVLQRFHREVEAVAKLSHPNIVAAHDADEHKGIHFLVMEYVDGVDLLQVVQQQGPLPVERAVDYITQAARGLEHAHAQGIIHRDIKPSNLLLDRQGTIRILDMGLARFEERHTQSDPEQQATGLTETGSIIGTVDFMAPEQAVNSRHASIPSDVYSLGCTLYYLLTGGPPYAGETLMARIVAHRESPIPSLPEVAESVPPQLDAIFRKMVAKQPEKRFQSAGDLLAALDAWQRGPSASVLDEDREDDDDIPPNLLSAIFDE